MGYDDTTVGGSGFEKIRNSYNNAITTLNAKAEKYLNTTYASDARCVGSVPNNKNAEATDYFTSSESYMTNYNGKLKNSDTNYETDYNQMIALGIANVNSNSIYWLASRCVDFKSNIYGYIIRSGGYGGYHPDDTLRSGLLL